MSYTSTQQDFNINLLTGHLVALCTGMSQFAHRVQVEGRLGLLQTSSEVNSKQIFIFFKIVTFKVTLIFGYTFVKSTMNGLALFPSKLEFSCDPARSLGLLDRCNNENLQGTYWIIVMPSSTTSASKYRNDALYTLVICLW